MNKKTIAIFAVCMVLVCALSVFTTLALLQDQTSVITNTFTSGNVDIELYEHKGDEVITNGTNDTYKFTPGSVQSKDPTIVLKTGSEPAYVALKVEFTNFPSANGGTNLVAEYLTGVAEGTTTQLIGTLNATGDEVKLYSGSYIIYFNDAQNATADTTELTGVTGASFEMFENVNIPSAFTNAQIDAVNATADGASIKVSAFAVQSANTTGGALAALQAAFNELKPAA